MELYTMPCSMFQILYQIAYERMQSEDGAKEVAAGELEDMIEGG